MTNQNTTTAAKALTASGLCKHYGKQEVLKKLDVKIEPGLIYGLIGRNGAGKTTLLSILTGQNTKDGGEVRYGGAPVWENAAALGELCFARELSPASEIAQLSVKDYLRAAALFCPHWDEAYATRLLDGFAIERKKKISKLSKGQMSMVTIAVALASCAPVTLLDEPVAGLDVVMREKFYRLLLDDYAKTNRTFVISTHIIEEAASVFERVLIMDEGKIVEDAPCEELVDAFRHLSGPAPAVDAAVAEHGLTVLQTQNLGGHKMVAVRGNDALFEELAAEPALELSGMSLQNVFVALCGHGDEEG